MKQARSNVPCAHTQASVLQAPHAESTHLALSLSLAQLLPLSAQVVLLGVQLCAAAVLGALLLLQPCLKLLEVVAARPNLCGLLLQLRLKLLEVVAARPELGRLGLRRRQDWRCRPLLQGLGLKLQHMPR